MVGTKWVVDVEQLKQVTICIGQTIEVPLTREQVVELLFGDEFEMVKKTSIFAPKRRSRAALPDGIKGLLPPAPADIANGKANGSGRKAKPGRYDAEVISFVRSRRDPIGLGDLREMLNAKHPETNGKNAPFFNNILARLSKLGTLTRVGERGQYRYAIANGLNGHAVIENVQQDQSDIIDSVKAAMKEARRKKSEKRFRDGLCLRCDKKHLKDKKLCREHYAGIMKAQSKAQKVLSKIRKAAN